MNGFLSFNVGETLNTVAKSGILLSVFSGEPGVFTFKLAEDEGETTNYQVSVSNDGSPIDWNVTDRGEAGFMLQIFQPSVVDGALVLTPFNPDVLCTVSVERKLAS